MPCMGHSFTVITLRWRNCLQKMIIALNQEGHYVHAEIERSKDTVVIFDNILWSRAYDNWTRLVIKNHYQVDLNLNQYIPINENFQNRQYKMTETYELWYGCIKRFFHLRWSRCAIFRFGQSEFFGCL